MVKSYRDCLDAVVEATGKLITKADAADLLNKVGKATNEEMAKGQAYKALVDLSNELIDQQIIANQWVDLSNKLAAMQSAMIQEAESARIRTRVEQGEKVSDIIKEMTMKGGSIERAASGMREMFVAPLVTTLEKNKLADAWLDETTMTSVVDALFRETAPTDPAQKTIYDALTRTIEMTRVLANEVGIPVDRGPLSLLSAKTFTNSMKVAAMGEDAFVEFFEKLVRDGHIDETRLVIPKTDGKRAVADPMSKARQYAEQMYKNLTATRTARNEFNTPDYLANSGKINKLHQRIGALQTIPFKTSEGFLQWAGMFSDKSLGEGLYSRISSIGGSLGMAQRFGRNPGRNLEGILRSVQDLMTPEEAQFYFGATTGDPKDLADAAKIGAGALKLGITQPHPGALMAAVSGDLEVPANPWLATATSLAMSWTSVVKLALGIFSMPLDAAWQGQYLAKHWEVGRTTTILNNIRALAPSASEKEALSQIGLTAQATLDALRNVNGSFSYMPQMAQNAISFGFKINGMAKVDRAMRTASATLIENTIFSGRELSEQVLSELAPYGLDQAAIARLSPYAEKIGDFTLLNPEKVPLELAPDLAKFTMAMNDFIINAITTPTAAQRATLSGGLRAGTGAGSLFRILTHFKSFPLAMTQRTLPRVMGDAGWAGIIGTSAAAYGLWYLSDSTKQALLLGREPKNPFSPETMAMGLAYSGGLGMAELALPKEGQTGERLLSGLAGPTATSGAKIAAGAGKTLFGLRDSVLEMELSADVGKGIGNMAKELLPYPLAHTVMTQPVLRKAFFEAMLEAPLLGDMIDTEFDLADKRAKTHYNTYGSLYEVLP